MTDKVDPLAATDYAAPRAETGELPAQATHIGPAPAPAKPPGAMPVPPPVVESRRAAVLDVAEPSASAIAEQPSASVIAPPAATAKRSSRAWIVVVALVVIAGAAVAIVLAMQSGPDEPNRGTGNKQQATGSGGSSTSTSTSTSTSRPDAGLGLPSCKEHAPDCGSGSPSASTAVVAHSTDELLDLEHAAIAAGDTATLAALLAPDAIAFGPGAAQVASGRDAVVQLIGVATSPAGKPVKVKSSDLRVGREGDAAWISETLALTPPAAKRAESLVTTQLAVADHGAWRTVAWHIAVAMPDDDAYRAASKHHLSELAKIDAGGPDDAAAAFRAAFASRRALAAAFATRDDAITIGSAPGDLIIGGKNSRTWFTKMDAELHLDGGAHCGVAAAATWCAGNVAFTAKTKYGKVTETFRTLAVFVRGEVVLAQFSNGM